MATHKSPYGFVLYSAQNTIKTVQPINFRAHIECKAECKIERITTRRDAAIIGTTSHFECHFFNFALFVKIHNANPLICSAFDVLQPYDSMAFKYNKFIYLDSQTSVFTQTMLNLLRSRSLEQRQRSQVRCVTGAQICINMQISHLRAELQIYGGTEALFQCRQCSAMTYYRLICQCAVQIKNKCDSDSPRIPYIL